jgi:hypothetical protein
MTNSFTRAGTGPVQGFRTPVPKTTAGRWTPPPANPALLVTARDSFPMSGRCQVLKPTAMAEPNSPSCVQKARSRKRNHTGTMRSRGVVWTGISFQRKETAPCRVARAGVSDGMLDGVLIPPLVDPNRTNGNTFPPPAVLPFARSPVASGSLCERGLFGRGCVARANPGHALHNSYGA